MKYTLSTVIVILAFAGGMLTQAYRAIPDTPVEKTFDLNPGVAVVIFDRIENGKLMGHGSGTPVRLLTRTELEVPQTGGTFAISLNDLGLKNTAVTNASIPEWAQFVASKNGKKYYPVNSSRAKTLSEKTRIFFPDAKSATQQGYTP
jgi:hypothetical protein